VALLFAKSIKHWVKLVEAAEGANNRARRATYIIALSRGMSRELGGEKHECGRAHLTACFMSMVLGVKA